MNGEGHHEVGGGHSKVCRDHHLRNLGRAKIKGNCWVGAEDLHLLVQQETLSSRKHEQLRCRDRIQEEQKRAASTLFNRGLLIVVGKLQRI